VPDWVYEEEIFSADYATWWSPDSKKVAFLTFDETSVNEFTFPIYNPTGDSDAIIPYTEEITMKYPKPGYNNPLVSVRVFDLGAYLDETAIIGGVLSDDFTLELDWEGRQAQDSSIIMDIAWVGNNSLILKEVNRNADVGNVVLFDLDGPRSSGRNVGQVVRKLGRDGEQGDDGWIDATQTVFPLPPGLSPHGSSAYLDIVPSKDGFDHIALFIPASSGIPIFLTSGEWEVTGEIQAVDVERRLVYVSSNFWLARI